MHLDMEGIGRYVFHDGDQVAGHGLDLAQVPALGRTTDLWNVNVPEAPVALNVSTVSPHFRHQPSPSSSWHSCRMSSAVRCPISLWRGIGIFVEPSQKHSCGPPPPSDFQRTSCRLASRRIFFINSVRFISRVVYDE